MSAPAESMMTAQVILALCDEHYGRAVDLSVELGRALWELAIDRPSQSAAAEAKTSRYRAVNREEILECLAARGVDEHLGGAILSRLHATHLPQPDRGSDAELSVRLDAFNPVALTRALLGGLRPDHELRYFVMNNIRATYGCTYNNAIVHDFSVMASALGELEPREKHVPRPASFEDAPPDQASPAPPQPGRFKRSGKRHFYYQSEVRASLRMALARGVAAPGENDDDTKWVNLAIDLFLECCRAVGFVAVSTNFGCLERRTESIDSEYLVSCLFALTTGIRGFDELFGGSGPLLGRPRLPGSAEPPARAILLTGPFGAGKSLLGLQLGVEVAHKGGIALFLLLEQTPEEYLVMLESIGAVNDPGPIDIATNTEDAAKLLLRPRPGRGALVFLEIGPSKNSYSAFLRTLRRIGRQVSVTGNSAGTGGAAEYPLRMLVVDPINSVNMDTSDLILQRARLLRVLRWIRARGTNVLMVAEYAPDDERGSRFEASIADTVIGLSVREKYGYSQRYFAIKKSRLQREQRGEHPFSIRSGSGINIYPTSSAVLARIRTRTSMGGDEPVKFGLPPLDAILGHGAIALGDVVVVRGPGGFFERELGLAFLLSRGPREGRKSDRPRKALHISVRSGSSVVRDEHQKARNWLRVQHGGRNDAPTVLDKDDVVVCALPHGHVQPGFVLDSIDRHFLSAQIEGYEFDRVLVDDVEHWELSCPFIRDDETFGDTLLSTLRSKGVTSLLICRDASIGPSVVQEPIIGGASCEIIIQRYQFRGQTRAILRVARTRNHQHRSDGFEVFMGPRGLVIKPEATLLRVDPDEQVREVQVRVLLHAETALQSVYNQKILNILTTVLSNQVEFSIHDRVALGRGLDLGTSSVVDELQVIQFDEFQLPLNQAQRRPSTGDGKGRRERSGEDTRSGPQPQCGPVKQLWHFPREPHAQAHKGKDSPVRTDSRRRADWEEACFPRLIRRVRDADSYFAVPFYTNLGLLAHRVDSELSSRDLGSWKTLSDLVCKYENGEYCPPGERRKLFFDCPWDNSENINCFFLEILFSIDSALYKDRHPDLSQWLRRDSSFEAAAIFRRLCQPAYLTRTSKHHEITDGSPVLVEPDCFVWRHWYTTLNQMLTDFDPSERERIVVQTLPGDVAVAGEWYLALPAYTAAPDIGLQIIMHLTRRDVELDRLWAGVGMPIRQDFYSDAGTEADRTLSPYFNLDGPKLSDLIENAFMRSNLPYYSKISRRLASHLLEIVRLAPGKLEHDVTPTIKARFKDFIRDIDYIKQHKDSM